MPLRGGLPYPQHFGYILTRHNLSLYRHYLRAHGVGWRTQIAMHLTGDVQRDHWYHIRSVDFRNCVIYIIRLPAIQAQK